MPKKYIPKAIQKQLTELANGSCEYCKILQAFFFPNFTNEHIIPTSLGGSDNLSNLAKACYAVMGQSTLQLMHLTLLLIKLCLCFILEKIIGKITLNGVRIIY